MKKLMKRQEVTRQYQDNKNQKEKKVKVFILHQVELHFLKSLLLQEIILFKMLFSQSLNQ